MITESKLVIKNPPRSLVQCIGTRSLSSKDRLKFGILAIIWCLTNSEFSFWCIKEEAIIKAPVPDLSKVFVHVFHNKCTLLNGKSYVKFVIINICLGFARLRNRGQVVDINIDQDGPKDAPLWHSTLNWKFVWDFGIYTDSLKSVRQIARKPAKSCRGQADISQL